MRKYVAPMQAEMHSQARPLPRLEPARELRLARMCRSRRPVPREAPRSRTRVTTRRARKSRPRYSDRYAHTRNAMRSAPIEARSLRCSMFAESIPYILILNVRRYRKFVQYYEHLRIMQYYEHLRGLPVCYHCACTAASQEVRNRTFARCFPQTGVGKARWCIRRRLLWPRLAPSQSAQQRHRQLAGQQRPSAAEDS